MYIYTHMHMYICIPLSNIRLIHSEQIRKKKNNIAYYCIYEESRSVPMNIFSKQK